MRPSCRPGYRAGVAELAAAVAVRPAGAPGSFTTQLDPHWCIGDKLNGGYLLAVLAEAARAVAGPDHPHPEAVSAHFLAAPEPGPAEVSVLVLRRGRAVDQLHATLSAGGRRCVEALLTCGRLAPAAPPYWSRRDRPDLPAEADCVPVPPHPHVPVPLFDTVSVRLDPQAAGFATGRPTGRAELTAWVRIPPDRPDPAALLVALDALPPPTFDLGLVTSWVPTLELTAYLRALPAPGPLLVRQRARMVAADRVDQECDVWDSTGALVGSAFQLAAVRLPAVP
jgi:hypothetical protein